MILLSVSVPVTLLGVLLNHPCNKIEHVIFSTESGDVSIRHSMGGTLQSLIMWLPHI